MGNFVDLTGQRFGRLTVIKKDPDRSSGKHRRVICVCDCGTQKSIAVDHLRNGHIKSCGCLKAETCIDNLPEECVRVKHGMSKSHLYQIYEAMMQRCYNHKKPFFGDYGGRGVRVCEAWKSSPTAFIEWALSNGYSDGLSIDRKDVYGNYEPSNCRWADDKTQMRNRRNTWKVSYCGRERAVSEWCEILGLNYGTVSGRLRRGKSVEEAFEHRGVPA